MLNFTLSDTFGFPFDASVIELFNTPSLSIAVYTNLTSKIGKYPLMLTA
jgi:hypothetical protein